MSVHRFSVNSLTPPLLYFPQEKCVDSFCIVKNSLLKQDDYFLDIKVFIN